MPKQATPSGTGISAVSVAALRRELSRRHTVVVRLERKRDRLVAKVSRLNRQITEMGGTANGSRRGPGARPRNKTPLVPALVKVMTGKTMSAPEAAEAVASAGYRSSAANFRLAVSIALSRSKQFKRVERGRYTAK